ncbi:carbonic anhydrase 2-like [Lineus longissimus]|uniref:carbonic anhydrase 2-like n=1 Tax=Lineus longissimus TaxID=88925 RepID=UPI002B4E7F5C
MDFAMRSAAVLILVAGLLDAVTWNYDPTGDHGPHNWHNMYADECDSTKYPRQSPINIERGLLHYDPGLDDMRLNNFGGENVTWQVKNTGHTIKFDVIDNNIESEGGPVGDIHYYVLNLHIHWGDDNETDGHGSEHTILGQQHRAEMHIVHVNHMHQHLGEPDLLQKDDGLLVLGIFIDVANQSKGQVPNKEFEKISEAAKMVKDKAGMVQNLTTGFFNLGKLLPSNLHDYYTYPGGLTTPNCHGAVTWVVWKQVIYITQEQLNLFFTVKDEDGNNMTNTWRPPQPVNHRIVRTTAEADGLNGSTCASASWGLLLSAFLWLRLSTPA